MEWDRGHSLKSTLSVSEIVSARCLDQSHASAPHESGVKSRVPVDYGPPLPPPLWPTGQQFPLIKQEKRTVHLFRRHFERINLSNAAISINQSINQYINQSSAWQLAATSTLPFRRQLSVQFKTCRPWPKDIFEQAQDRVYRLGNAATLPTTVADRQLTETNVTNGWFLPIIMKIKNRNEPRTESKRVVIVSWNQNVWKL